MASGPLAEYGELPNTLSIFLETAHKNRNMRCAIAAQSHQCGCDAHLGDVRRPDVPKSVEGGVQGRIRSNRVAKAQLPMTAACAGPETEISEAEFSDLLAKIDQGLRALPATAQARSSRLQWPRALHPFASATPLLGSRRIGSMMKVTAAHVPARPVHKPTHLEEPSSLGVPGDEGAQSVGLLPLWCVYVVQVAKQQGEYLAKLLKAGVQPETPLPEGVEPFWYAHKGSLAYVGAPPLPPHVSLFAGRLDGEASFAPRAHMPGLRASTGRLGAAMRWLRGGRKDTVTGAHPPFRPQGETAQ